MTTWTIERLKDELQRVSDMVDDKFNCPVFINGRLSTTLGRVFYHVCVGDKIYPEKVEFSKRFLENSTDEAIVQVIKHEWVHYYLAKVTKEDHGHDKVFKETCAKIGCVFDSCVTNPDKLRAGQKQYKYDVFCPKCGKQTGTHYSRMTKTLKHRILYDDVCPHCGARGLGYEQNW